MKIVFDLFYLQFLCGGGYNSFFRCGNEIHYKLASFIVQSFDKMLYITVMNLYNCCIETIKGNTRARLFSSFLKCQSKCTIKEISAVKIPIFRFKQKTYFLRTSPKVGALEDARIKHV